MDESGRVLYTNVSARDGAAYNSWLADYLFANADARSEFQAELCRYVAGLSKDAAMRELGLGALKHHVHARPITMSVRFLHNGVWAPKDWEPTEDVVDSVQNDVLASFSRLSAPEPDNPEFTGHWERPVPPSREQVARVLRAEKQSERCSREAGVGVDDRANFTDLGWRIPLAVVLEDVMDRKERERLLDIFFQHITEDLD
jgi:hypothetical protein